MTQRLARLFAAIAFLAYGAQARAQTVISWSAGSGLFATPSNWTGSAVPTSSQVAGFAQAGGTVTLGAPATVSGVQFAATAGSYSLQGTGSALTVGSFGLRDLALTSETISVPLVFSAASTPITNENGGKLSLGSSGSSLTMNAGSSLIFTVAGGSETTVAGNIFGGGSITKEGGGTLRLSGTGSAYSGETIVSQGTLEIAAGSSMAIPSGAVVTVNAQGGSAELLLNGTSQQFSKLTLGGASNSGLSSNVVDLGGVTGYLAVGGVSPGLIVFQRSSTASKDPATGQILQGTVELVNGGSINVEDSRKAAIDLYLSSKLVSSGAISKTGDGMLLLDGANSSLGGDLVVSAGGLLVGRDFGSSTGGTGKIDVRSGAVLAGGWFDPAQPDSLADVSLNRAVILHSGAQLGAAGIEQGRLILAGTVSIDQTTTLKVAGQGGIEIAGGIGAASSGARLTFSSADSASPRSTVGITGEVSVKITSIVSSGPAVIFSQLPSSSTLYATTGGYVGLAPASTQAVAPSASSLIGLVGSSKNLFRGTFGFDSAKTSAGNLQPTTYSEDLDFTGFSTQMTLGSMTGAILSGKITPADPSTYAFGNGTGVLLVTSPLTDRPASGGARSVSAKSSSSLASNSLGLVLQGNNSFSGNVTVDNSVVIFDSLTAFPAAAGQKVLLAPAVGTGAYVGTTEVSNLSLVRNLLPVLGQYSASSIIGFDSHDYIAALSAGGDASSAATRVVRDRINLAPLNPVYLGTATQAVLEGTLTAPALGVSLANRTLYFGGVGSGRLQIASLLDPVATSRVTVGGSSTLDLNGTVSIDGRNTYTGGTTLLSGTLAVGTGTVFQGGALTAGPLGTGLVTIGDSSNNKVLRAMLGAGDTVVLGNDIKLNGSLSVGGDYSSEGPLLKLTGVISGDGGLLINNSAVLGGINTFGGGVTLAGGLVTLGTDRALGDPSGQVMISQPRLGDGSYPAIGFTALGNREIANPVVVAQSDNDYAYLEAYGSGALKFKGSVQLNSGLSLGAQSYPVTFSGPISGSGYFVNSGYATAILSGSNSYQGGTFSYLGPVIFSGVTSIPSAQGSLISSGWGYVGLASTNFGAGSYQSVFVDRFDKTRTSTALGFDSLPDSSGNLSVNSFSGSVDLTGFSSTVRLGSATRAILSGAITPQGSVYRFGGGGGLLEVQSSLGNGSSGSRSLEVSLPADSASVYQPLTVRLSGMNPFAGGVTVANSAVIFSALGGSMPSGGGFTVKNFGYFGTEDVALFNAGRAAYLGRFTIGPGGAVVGFDVVSGGTPTPLTGTIDLRALTIDPSVTSSGKPDPAVYLGTTTQAEIGAGASVILPLNQTDYRFTGYKGGELTVSASLTGSSGVRLGSAAVPASAANPSAPGGALSTVVLKGTNTYTGDTVLEAGQLVIGSNSALGSSTASKLRVLGPSYADVLALPQSPVLAATSAGGGPWTISNGVILDNSALTLGGANNFTLAGVIADASASPDVRGSLFKTGSSVVTLSGANTFSGGISIQQGSVVLAHGQAAGTGPLSLSGTGSPTAVFSAASSALNGLSGDATAGTVQIGTVGSPASPALVITQSVSTEYAGAFAGAGARLQFLGTVRAPATLTLTGSSANFSGTTTVGADVTLRLANGNALGSSAVEIAGGTLSVVRGVTLTNPVSFSVPQGGTLGGEGTIQRSTPLSVGSGAVLAPGGDLPGVLSFTKSGGLNVPVLTFASGGALQVRMSDALDTLGGWDRISVAGLTSFDVPSGLFTVKLGFLSGTANFDQTQAYAWPIVTATSITGFAAQSVAVDFSGLTLPSGASFSTSLNLAGDTLLLNYAPVAVPEPSTWALMVSGAVGLACHLRRRRGRGSVSSSR